MTLLQKITHYDHIVKLLLVGNSSVGKTNIVTRFVDDNFNPNSFDTIGIDFRFKIITINDEKYKLQIWDTSGKQKFHNIVVNYFPSVNGILLVYDVTNEQSFLDIEKWLDDIENYASENVIVILIGNKSDMTDQKVISTSRGNELAHKHNIRFIETSAKNDDNIINTFTTIVNDIKLYSPTDDRPPLAF